MTIKTQKIFAVLKFWDNTMLQEEPLFIMGQVQVGKIEAVVLKISMDNTRSEYVIKNLKDHPIQSFSYIEQNQICSSFTIITSLYITCIYTYIMFEF